MTLPLDPAQRTSDDVLDLPPVSFDNLIKVAAGPVDWELCFPEWVHRASKPELDQRIASQDIILNATIKDAMTDDMAFRDLKSMFNRMVLTRRLHGLWKVHPMEKHIRGGIRAGIYKKCVVVCQHRDTVNTLRDLLRVPERGKKRTRPVALYPGLTERGYRMKLKRWVTQPKYKVLVAHIDALDWRADLSVAHHMFFLDYSWDAGVNARAVMRMHHEGQKKPVQVRFMAVKGTWDEVMAAAAMRATRTILGYDSRKKVVEKISTPDYVQNTPQEKP